MFFAVCSPMSWKATFELVADLLVDVRGDADAAGLGQPLEPRRHIHAVAVDVASLDDHLADVDPEAEIDALSGGGAGIALCHAALYLERAADRIHYARELGEKAVARGLDDAPAMLADLGFDELPKMALEPGVGALLVRSHQPGVARHVGGQHGRKLSRGSVERHEPFLRSSGGPSAPSGRPPEPVELPQHTTSS